MSQQHKRFFIVTVALFILTLTFLVGTLFSAEQPDYEHQEYTLWNKLGRGVGNIATSVLEIPYQIDIAWDEYSVVGGTAVGVSKGVINFLERLGTGLYDTITFPIAKPAGFEPIMQPEFVFNYTKPTKAIDYESVPLDARRHYAEPGTER
ncbi:MAG: exosortase system-associated protein, TIGR04073 family [Candidatus Omnitrophica bacterium]|nr:exosortase system-associated protein, TIGR04073 family [Candidatus Omnitrophota bacterium]